MLRGATARLREKNGIWDCNVSPATAVHRCPAASHRPATDTRPDAPYCRVEMTRPQKVLTGVAVAGGAAAVAAAVLVWMVLTALAR